MREKREWVKPEGMMELFMPNEYLAACVTKVCEKPWEHNERNKWWKCNAVDTNGTVRTNDEDRIKALLRQNKNLEFGGDHKGHYQRGVNAS